LATEPGGFGPGVDVLGLYPRKLPLGRVGAVPLAVELLAQLLDSAFERPNSARNVSRVVEAQADIGHDVPPVPNLARLQRTVGRPFRAWGTRANHGLKVRLSARPTEMNPVLVADGCRGI